MRPLFAFVVALALLSGSALAAQAQKGTPAPRLKGDADLSRAPESYKKRLIEFRNILRKEPSREAKIKKATELAKKLTSPFRIDAVNFLAEIRARESVSDLIALAKDPEVKEFAVYALGELRSEKAVPALIAALGDPSENVRGNAEQAIKRITRISFSYRYSDAPAQRRRAIEEISRWWEKSKNQFKVRDETPEEMKEAEEAWEKYGKQYVQDLSR
jgi:hypothetical protein